MSILVDGVTSVDVYKIISTVCYGRRRLRRLLRDGPRKSAINECLVTVVGLLTEAIERPPPELARDGGLGLLSSLAGASSGLATTTRMASASVSAQSANVKADQEAVNNDNLTHLDVNDKYATTIAGPGGPGGLSADFVCVNEYVPEGTIVLGAVSDTALMQGDANDEHAAMSGDLGGPSTMACGSCVVLDASDVVFDDVLDVDAFYAEMEAGPLRLQSEARGVAAHQGCAEAHPSDDPSSRHDDEAEKCVDVLSLLSLQAEHAEQIDHILAFSPGMVQRMTETQYESVISFFRLPGAHANQFLQLARLRRGWPAEGRPTAG